MMTHSTVHKSGILKKLNIDSEKVILVIIMARNKLRKMARFEPELKPEVNRKPVI
jgi:hypothetical protein